MLHKHVWLIGLVLAVVMMSQGRADEKAQPTAADTAIRISAKELYTEYKASEKKANAKYKDKVLEVTGPVRHVDKTNADRVFVELGTSYGDDDTVKCLFGRVGSRVKDVKGGQQVVIRGTCAGLKGTHVNLSGCELVTE